MADGDRITVSIPKRSIQLEVDDEELAERRRNADADGWRPKTRQRPVSQALRIYGALAQSADKGAARRFDSLG